MKTFLNPRLLIADYYQSLRFDLDIYTEEMLKSVNSIQSLDNNQPLAKSLVDAKPSHNENLMNTDLNELETELKDPYVYEYYIEVNNGIIDHSELKMNDYLNWIRAEALKELKIAEEENLSALKSINLSQFKLDGRNNNYWDEDRIESLRRQLFSYKFCFLAKIDQAKLLFKVCTIVLDFYLDKSEVDLFM